MRGLRVTICGSRSTGKTTLAGVLAKELGLPQMAETSRDVLSQDLSTLTAGEKQEIIVKEQIEREKILRETGYVSCRSMIDAMAFSLTYPKLSNICSRYLRQAVSPYDYIFFIPIIAEIPFVPDEVRGSDERERFYEQNNIIKLIHRFALETSLLGKERFKIINSTTVDGRVMEIRDFMGLKDGV